MLFDPHWPGVDLLVIDVETKDVEENVGEEDACVKAETPMGDNVVEDKSIGKRTDSNQYPRPSNSASKLSADAIKAQLTALKNPRLRANVHSQPRQLTPVKVQPQRRPIQSPKKAPLPIKYSQLLETFSGFFWIRA